MSAMILAHGGAGEMSDLRAAQKLKVMPHTIVAGIKKMQSALEKVKDDNLEIPTSTALQVACAVVSVMEDDAAFNAGYGSMQNEDCNIEMDAAVMDGKNRSYGSIAILEGFANPIYIAEKVLTSSSACMLASNGAKRFAEKHGFRTVPLSHLLAPETVEAFHQWKKEKAKGIIMNEAGGAGSSNPIVKDGSHGTVGAVVMDFDGNLAAATSTGGLLGNEVGRIGDTPIAGMGVFADNKLGAVSTTGIGECLMRSLSAYEIAVGMGKQQLLPNVAIRTALDNMSNTVGGDGGAISISPEGKIGVEWNSYRMAWASVEITEEFATEDRSPINIKYGCSRNEEFEYKFS